MDFDLLHTRVAHHLETGREAEAIALLKDNLNDYQQFAEFWILYSACHLNLEQWGEAEATARAALGLNAEHPIAGEQLAVALAGQRRRGEALATIHQVIATAPEYARAHHLLGMILLGNVQNNDERILARQATEHALELEPENPDFYQGAALAADVAGDQRSALHFLETGLRIDPHHQGLLRSAGNIENGHKVVGDHGQLLRGMLASDPMNEKLHQDYAENFLEKQAVYANRWWVFVPGLATVASFGFGANVVGSIVVIVLLLACAGLFAWWNISTDQKTKKLLPSGYLNDIHARFPTLGKALRCYQISWGVAVLGAIAGCFVPLIGATLMILSAVLGRVASALILREVSGPPKDRTDREARRIYLVRLSGGYAAGFWKRVLLVVVQVILFVVCMAHPSQIAAVPLGSIGVGLLTIAGILAYCQLRLGFKNNAFAYGLAVSASAKSRGFALLRGNVGGLYFIGLHLLIGLVAFSASLALLGEVPAPAGNSQDSVNEKPKEMDKVLPTQLPSPTHENFSFSPMPELPEITELDEYK
ncbi:hypothetical protein [Glutamicibacter sp. JC586]|uniref:hypothetical protein n=1 Tax=Glutamicibacter sp. JC586 TaxID=2590552 RepID=UPI00135788F9|nr:hypothetical protein [Glutamicibacter sp. JC586]